MQSLIGETLLSSLHEQIAHEKYNANLYLVVACQLKNRGLNNLAKIFEKQHEEETTHAKMICDFLTDLGCMVIIPKIDKVDDIFNSITDIANAYLDREIYTTESLNAIKKLAMDDNNPVAEEFLREMIRLQRHEYSEATDFLDKAILVGSDWKSALMWDLEL